MFKKIIITGTLLLLVVSAVACSSSSTSPQVPSQEPAQTNPTPPPATPENPAPPEKPEIPKPSGSIEAKWIEPEIDGSIVSIPVSEVENNWNTHFRVELQGSIENYMAYILDGTIYVRANVCPPCGSIGFSLDDDILVCNMCATTFEADTGDGIQGACVNYPKALVLYKINGDNIEMTEADLLKAYEETLQAG